MSELRYHSPSSHLHLQRMETIFTESNGRTDKPHRHDYYTMIWSQKASKGKHLIDFREYGLDEDAVFFVSPGQVHQVITPEEPRGWVVTFSKSFLQYHHISEEFIERINLFNGFEERPPLFLPKNVAEKMQAIFEMMESDYGSPSEYQIGLLSAYLKIFLIHCVNICDLGEREISEEHGGKSILKNFKKLVETHFRKWHKVSEYAEQMTITPKYLNQVVKSLVGQTAKEVIQEKIILNAKRELKYSDKSIKEIAYELGFADPLYFSHFFKKCAGSSPSAFKSGKV